MFKNSLKFTCMYGMKVFLNITCMYDISVHNAAHKYVCLHNPTNHIESKSK